MGGAADRPVLPACLMARKRKPLPSAYERPERDAALARLAAEARRKRAEAAAADYRRRQRERDKVLPALPPDTPPPPLPPETVVRVEVKQYGGIFSACADTLVGVVGLIVAVVILIAVCGAS